MKINEIPLWLKPFLYFYGFIVGEVLNFYYWLCHQTCSIEIKNLKRHNEHAVFVLWHSHLNFYFTAFRSFKRQAWLNHPFIYMMPYYYLLKKYQCSYIALGSSGAEGRKAADELLVEIKKGLSTLVALDGPYGPAHEPKSGAFYFALEARIPIYPLRFSYKRCLRIPTWDNKTFMLPFLSELKIEILDPVQVNTKEEISQLKLEVTACLNELRK